MPAALAYQRHKLTPAQPGYIVLKLTRLSLHSWQPERPKEHIQAIIEDYVEDLGNVPSDILDETIRICRQTLHWFPKIHELLEIAEPKIQKRRDELHKLERVAETLADELPQEDSSPTEEEMARRSELLNKLVASLTATSESLRPKSGNRINRGQPPTQDDEA
jgi:hypothetical protein